MIWLEEDTIGRFNAMISKQKEIEGETGVPQKKYSSVDSI